MAWRLVGVVLLCNQYEAVCVTYTAFENGALVTKQVEGPFYWNDEYGSDGIVLENVVVGTSVTWASFFTYSFTGENFEEWFVAENMWDVGTLFYNLKILGDATVTIAWET